MNPLHLRDVKKLYEHFCSLEANEAQDSSEEVEVQYTCSEDITFDFHNAFVAKEFEEFLELLDTFPTEISSEVMESCFLDACHFDNAEYAKAIIEKRVVDPNVKDEKNNTALLYACINKNLPLVECLVKNGACIDTLCQGVTAPLSALGSGSLEIVEFLLENGADVESKDLMDLVFRTQNIEALKLMQRHGATIDTSNPSEVFRLFKNLTAGFDKTQNLEKPRRLLLELLNEQGQLKLNLPSTVLTDCIQKALENGFTDVIDFLVENGLDLSKASPIDTLNIFETAMKSKVAPAYIKQLIDYGLDCTATHPHTFDTPLHYACLHNKEDAIHILFESGAKKEVTNTCGYTPFDFALRHVANEAIIEEFMSNQTLLENFRLIIDSPYNLLRPEHFQTLIKSQFFDRCPIDFFTMSSLFSTSKKLIQECKKRYPDFTKDPKIKDSILTFAEEGKLDLIENLYEEGVPLPDGDEHANSPLHLACKSQDIELIEWLIDHECDVNSKNAAGETILHFVISQDNVELEVIDLLMENKFDLYATNDLGESLFTAAIKTKQGEEVIENLLEHDKESRFLTMPSKNGKTFLHYIAKKGNFQALQYLLDNHKFDIDPQDAQGQTPLMILLLKEELNNKHKKIMNTLLEKGADLTRKDAQGRNILHYLYQGKPIDENIQKLLVKKAPHLLLEKDCNGRTPLHLACMRHSKIELATLFHIVRKHCDFNDFASLIDNDQNNLLHYAAQNPDEHLLQYLIDLGCQIDLATSIGELPIHVALANRKVVHAQKFLKLGVLPTAQLNNGTTCLDIALMQQLLPISVDLINRGALLFSSKKSHSLPSTYWQEQIPSEIRQLFLKKAISQCSIDPDFSLLFEENDMNSTLELLKTHPENLLQYKIPTEKILEFLWMTQDPALVAKVIPAITQEQFSEGLQRLTIDVPIETLQEYFTFSEINSDHFAIEITPKNLPDWTDETVQITDLEALIAELNFDDPKDDNYIEPSLLAHEGKTYTAKDLVAYFKTYVSRIAKEKEFSLTPPKGSTQLKLFYHQLKKAVLPLVAKLKALGTTKEEKELKMKVLLSILPGISLCGPRWQRDALMAYTKFCLNKPVDFSLSCLQLLQEHRGLIIEDFADRRNAHNIHYPLAIIKHFGDELGLVRGEFEDNFHDTPISREQVLHKFFKTYTVDDVINLVHAEVCNTSSFRDQLVDLLFVLYKDVKPPVGEDLDEHLMSLWYDGRQIKREIIVQVLEHLGIIRSIKPM